MIPTDSYNPGTESVRPTAAPTLQTERVRNDPGAGSVTQLLAALGSDSTQKGLAELNQQHEAKKVQDQNAKFDWYVEQFQKDQASGAVSQAQVKERFPETVPIISSRIAEAVGQKQGRMQFQAVIDQVAGDDALRLDTGKRGEFLAKARAELVNSVGKGNEFYGAGLVSAMDGMIRQHDQQWQSETAAYHQKVQAEQFSGYVTEAINNGEDTAAALIELDGKFRVSSSLNDLERNKIVVSTAIDLAFVNDDLEVLRAVPARFLNVDSKAALEKARTQMVDRRVVNIKQAKELKEALRAESLRSAKLEMIELHVSGQKVDPAAYRDDPEKFAYAMLMREVPKLDESTSAANMHSMRNLILTQATTGENSDSLYQLTDKLASNPNINPKHRQELIAELPKLIEGRNLMADDMVRQPVTDRLSPRLKELASSTNAGIQAMMTGRNLNAEVMRGYDNDIRRSFRAEYEDTGKWPAGHRKLQLIDKAVERAEKLMETATRIGATLLTVPPPSIQRNAVFPRGVAKQD